MAPTEITPIPPPEGFPEGTEAETRVHTGEDWQKYSRSRWPVGPWTEEPWDVIRWVDPVTSLHCLLARSTMGSWCGYVGIDESHPWFKVDDSGCINHHAPYTYEERKTQAEDAMNAAWASLLADPTNPTLQSGYRLAELMFQGLAKPESMFAGFDRWPCLEYPRGACSTPSDHLETHGGITFGGNRDAYASQVGLWWFGFDCNHSCDIAPGMLASSKDMREIMEAKGDHSGLFSDHLEYDPSTGSLNKYGNLSVYRSVAYAKAEVEGLALQLKKVADEKGL